MADMVFGLFPDWPQAETAVRRLREAGFHNEDIGVLAKDRRHARELAGGDLGHGEDGAYIGAAAGSILGGTAGWAIGLTALAIPGAGPLLAAGPVLAGLAGFALGAGGGGLVGYLIGAGIPEPDALMYHDAIERGQIVVTVATDGRAEEVRRLMLESGAISTNRHDEVPVPGGLVAASPAPEETPGHPPAERAAAASAAVPAAPVAPAPAATAPAPEEPCVEAHPVPSPELRPECRGAERVEMLPPTGVTTAERDESELETAEAEEERAQAAATEEADTETRLLPIHTRARF